MEVFDQWLTRGGSRKAALRSWFAGLVGDGELVSVEVDGEPGYARAADVEEIAATRLANDVRLLPAFDQYVLGPGTKNTQIIDAARRGEISKAGGWISPVVIAAGRVVGTWESGGDALDITVFKEAGGVPASALEAEAQHLTEYFGSELAVSTRTQ